MNKNHYIPITICKSRNKNVVTGELELIVAKPWSSFRRLDQGKKKKKKLGHPMQKMGTRIYNHIVNFKSYPLIQSLSPYQQV